jgi:hypothetical protein
VGLLALKLTLTPAVVTAGTLAARRFGPAIGGWLIGLPVTAGPVVLFLALANGSHFAGHVAVGLVAGVAAQAAFTVGYAAACRRSARWPVALGVGSVSFAIVGLPLVEAKLGLAVVAACALAALTLGLLYLPSDRIPPSTARPRHDLLVRIVLATGVLLLITTFATNLGPGLSGLATVYPLLSTTLAVFTHRTDGAAAALAVYRGLLVGLFALMGFACTIALLITHVSLGVAYALAIALTLAIQLGSLRAVRRPATA